MFDSHCHLTDIPEPLSVLAAALGVGVGPILSCGYDWPSNLAVSELRRAIPSLPIAFGLHPWFAEEAVDPVLSLIREGNPTALGEVGLDFWNDPPSPSRARQIEVLEIQLQLAGQMGLPVTLHSRKALPELDAVMRNHPKVRGALHAFGGSPEQALHWFSRGFLVGLGGGLTRERASRLRRVAVRLPLDAILLETDAPAIGMEGIEPPWVRPAHLPQVAKVLAELRGTSVDDIVQTTDANAERFFGVSVGKAAREVLATQLALSVEGNSA